jgi:hypothetical protein
MSLTSPELDLLRELLKDDPAHASFAAVGRELMSRGHTREAEAVLRAALAQSSTDDAWQMLTEVLVANGAPLTALKAAERAGISQGPLYIRALELSGARSNAHKAAVEYLVEHPGDQEVCRMLPRLEAPEPEGWLAADDPFLTVARAQQYGESGHAQRAVRVLRRIQFSHPTHLGLASLLEAAQARAGTDNPGSLPEPTAASKVTDDAPQFIMPAPNIRPMDAARAMEKLDHEETVLMTAATIAELLKKQGEGNHDEESKLSPLKDEDANMEWGVEVENMEAILPARKEAQILEKPEDALAMALADPDAITDLDDTVGDDLVENYFDDDLTDATEATDATVLYSPQDFLRQLTQETDE